MFSHLLENYTVKVPLDKKEVLGVQVNKSMSFSAQTMRLAVLHGMEMLITYRGKEDNAAAGHTRLIWPVCYGMTKYDKKLVKAVHVDGFSLSNGDKREWRVFSQERILNMSFTGRMFKLKTSDYNETDSIIKPIAKANYTQVSSYQSNLILKGDLSDEDNVKVTKGIKKDIKIRRTGRELNLDDPYSNGLFNYSSNWTVSLIRKKDTEQHFAVLGLSGDPDAEVTIKDGMLGLGDFIIISSTDAKNIKKITPVGEKKKFEIAVLVS